MTNGNKIKKGNGMSLNFTWESANFWANWILVGSLLIGVLATVTVIVSGSIKEAALKKDVAEANERTQKAALATEQLKAQLAWRTIDANQCNGLIARLSQNPGSVFIEYVMNDPESTFLAIQLEKIFSKAKWTTSARGNQYSGTILFGIFIPDDAANSGSVSSVRDAFSSVGLGFTTEKAPTTSIAIGGSQTPGAVDIVVGCKRPPLQ